MGQVTSLFVHKVLAQVDDSLNRRAFLEAVGIDPEAPIDPKVVVSDDDYYKLFADLARADANGLELPLRVGATMRCEDYGAFGLAWKSAPTLRASCVRAVRYARVLTSVATYEVREAEQGVLMILHRDGDRASLGLRLSNEATIASVAAISREVSIASFRPLAVHFRHELPGSNDVHARHFGCPVHFATDMDALLISKETMEVPNRVGDASIVQFFDTHLEAELSTFEDDVYLERRVRRHVSQCLSGGVPTVSDVAGHFGMSGRSLQRRLSERGHSYQKLVDEARRELAEQLLKDTAYPLAEVAFLTGFSEQSAFNRAFKRWKGQTPRSFRLQA